MDLPSRKPLHALLVLAALLVAIALRAPDLERRPMHTDEAVHAVKFGTLLEEGLYRYDNNEYHGPTLNYFTLIPAWAESAERLSEVDESTLRAVPVVFGLGLLLLLPLLSAGLGRTAVACAAVLTAVSPAMVFYSRYYIHEPLLVFFGFAALVCGYRYTRSRKTGWALATGVSLGLMHATKETSILLFAAMAVALALTLVTRERSSIPGDSPSRAIGHYALALAAALSVSALFSSSFFANPVGVIDSYSAYGNYLGRAQHEWHIHPWYYYLRMLFFFKDPAGPVWTEALILLLAGVAIAFVALKKEMPGVDSDLARFLSFYTLTLIVLYSAIPYKTPWNMLSALHGLILLAGVGAAALLAIPRRRSTFALLACGLVLAATHLARQSTLGNTEYCADPRNPYVYAHPTDDVIRTAERIQALAHAHPDGNDLFIEVIFPGHDYWPLPWYLRAFPNTGYWNRVDMSAPAAPLILAAPSVEADLLEKLYERPPPGEKHLYLPLFEAPTQMRPTIEMRGYVVKDLWDRYLQQNEPGDGEVNHR